ncbi:MAG: hypothetical protein R3D28_10360 [Geminicoccaceae bacterium]
MLQDQHDQPAADDDAEQQQQDEVDVEQQHHRLDAAPVGRCRGDHDIGGDARDDREDRQQQRQLALEIEAAQPMEHGGIHAAQAGDQTAQ